MSVYFDDFFRSNSSANSSCPSTPAKWCTDDDDAYQVCIENPSLIFPCLLALFIGLFCAKRIAKLPGAFPSRWFYQTAFFLFGIMMTTAAILHCIIGDDRVSTMNFNGTDDDPTEFFQLLVSVMDVGLTSNIAITILFCGLCDIKFFNPQATGTRYLLIIIYFFVFILWTLGILNDWQWVFDVLYLAVIGISCCVYLLTQLCLKKARRALSALAVAGIYGGFGLMAVSVATEQICESEGPFWSQYFGPQFIWFLFSDISMAFLFVYVIRANQVKKILPRTYTINMEKYPEKF